MAYISRHNSKLGNIPSINLSPILTCRKGAPCTKTCYACNGCFRFKNVKKTMSDNLLEWSSRPFSYQASVINACANVSFFRWHSAGDIPSTAYLDMMVNTAKRLPEVHFLCFTKKYELVNRYVAIYGEIPENLKIIFSAWGNLIPRNPNNFPIAYVNLKSGEGKEHIPEDAIPCHGSCNDCIKGQQHCWNLKFGQSVVFNQH